MQNQPPKALNTQSDSVPRRAILTVVTKSHLKYALTLARSCLTLESNCDFYIAVVDCLTTSELENEEYPKSIQWLSIEELQLPDWRRMAFQYTPFEFVCACKPFAMKVPRQRGCTEIVYVDADMWLYQPMDDVWELLKTNAVLLTPHLCQPLPNDGGFPTEMEYLRCGTFNAGFVAIHGNTIGDAMLDWWCNRMTNDCIVDILGSLFVDQKWLNLVPGLFPSVQILRHRGYNAGHWSLSQSKVGTTPDGRFVIGNDPLVLFHFSKFLPDDPYSFERQQTRFKLSEMPALKELVEGYQSELKRTRTKPESQAICCFEKLSCGTQIEPSWREAIRRRHPSLRDIFDPFDSSATPDLVARYRSLESESVEWRTDWKLSTKKRSKWSKAWKKFRRRFLDWWNHR